MARGKAAKDGVHLGFARALRGLAKRVARFAGTAPARILIAHETRITRIFISRSRRAYDSAEGRLFAQGQWLYSPLQEQDEP